MSSKLNYVLVIDKMTDVYKLYSEVDKLPQIKGNAKYTIHVRQ